jgi:hypothetical protein
MMGKLVDEMAELSASEDESMPMPSAAADAALDESYNAAAEAEAKATEEATEQVETLLDVYDARFNSLVDQILSLGSTIENTQVRRAPPLQFAHAWRPPPPRRACGPPLARWASRAARPSRDGPRCRLARATVRRVASQDVLELTLDNERNRIARLELLLSMVGLSVGTW